MIQTLLIVALAAWCLVLTARLARTRRSIARYMPAPKPSGPLLPVPGRLRLVGTLHGEPWHSGFQPVTWGPMALGVSRMDEVTYRVAKDVVLTAAETPDGYAMTFEANESRPFASDGTFILNAKWHIETVH